MVRHAQASFLESDYDRLSALGERQARALGEHWIEREIVPDRVYVGPRLRHRQTHAAVAAAYRERGLAPPEPVFLPELDEHQGQSVMEQVLPQLAERDPSIRDLVQRHHAGEPEAARQYLRLFQRVSLRWARGELEVTGIEEPWSAFRQRVRRAVEAITAQAGSGETVAAFTSGGVMAAVVGLALDLRDEKVIELSWTVRNAAYSEFLFSGERFSLSAFNIAAPLDAAHQTLV